MGKMNERLILVTNDDGYDSKGLAAAVVPAAQHAAGGDVLTEQHAAGIVAQGVGQGGCEGLHHVHATPPRTAANARSRLPRTSASATSWNMLVHCPLASR